MRGAYWLTIAVAALSITALTACAAEPAELADNTAKLPEVSAEKYANVTAELSFDSGTATTPISEYLTNMDFGTLVLFSQAHETLITQCMTKAGFTYTGLTDVDWSSLQPMSDRIFGLWDRAEVARLGVLPDFTRGVPKAPTVDKGVDFNNELTTCGEEAAAHEVLGPITEELNQLTLADRILGNAGELAQQSAEGKAVTAEFVTCMENKSIVLDPSSGYTSAEYSELGKEAEITAALGEADCNIDTGRMQKLYDLRAQYESAFIEKYEAQLAEVLKHKQEVHEKLQSIIDGES